MSEPLVEKCPKCQVILTAAGITDDQMCASCGLELGHGGLASAEIMRLRTALAASEKARIDSDHHAAKVFDLFRTAQKGWHYADQARLEAVSWGERVLKYVQDLRNAITVHSCDLESRGKEVNWADLIMEHGPNAERLFSHAQSLSALKEIAGETIQRLIPMAQYMESCGEDGCDHAENFCTPEHAIAVQLRTLIDRCKSFQAGEHK